MPLQIIRQDLTKMNVDAIVNTTNSEMVGYSGVDLAVHNAAGPELDAECSSTAPLELGFAKITNGYNLGCKYIIHTSGPIWKGGEFGEKAILKSCYTESLNMAKKYNCSSIAFPLISAGVYGYPKDQVLKYAVEVISEFLLSNEMMVYLCVFDKTAYEFSKSMYNDILSYLGDDFSKNDDLAETIDACSTPKIQPQKIGAARKSAERPIRPEINHSVCYSNCPSPPKENNREEFMGSVQNKSLEEYMKSMDKPFAYKLFDLIDKRGFTDVECYKKANIDKKTFSKIKCNPTTYKPSKQTAVAFAIALELNLEETQDLLASAGMTLSRSYTFDKIIRYFIQKGNYDIFEVNQALFEFDQVLLGV